MIDLASKKIFFFDLDDTLINTHEATELGKRRAYEKLCSECINDFKALPSIDEFKNDLKRIYSTKTSDGKKIFYDYDAVVFEKYCLELSHKTINLKHYEHSLAARLFWSFRHARNEALMALPGAFELLNSISQSNTIHCITQGECNYQHTKAMLTDIEQKVESVLVTYDKSIQLKSFIENKGYLHKEAVIIGDSQSDIVAGREAGIETVCVKSEKYDPEKFDVKADLVVEDLKELLDLLNSQIDL